MLREKFNYHFIYFPGGITKILSCDKVIKDHVAKKSKEKTYYKDKVGGWGVIILFFPDVVMFVISAFKNLYLLFFSL